MSILFSRESRQNQNNKNYYYYHFFFYYYYYYYYYYGVPVDALAQSQHILAQFEIHHSREKRGESGHAQACEQHSGVHQLGLVVEAHKFC